MHIAIVTDHAQLTGGIAKVAIDSALGLAERGHSVVFFAAAGPVDARLNSSRIEMICLDQPDLAQSPARGLTQGIWNLTARNMLSALLKRLPVGETVVHVHGWAKALSPSISSIIAKSGHPAFYTVHDYFLFCPNGGFYNYQKGHICSLRPMSGACLAEHCDSRSYAFKIWRVARQAVANYVARMPRNIGNLILISDMQKAIVSPYLVDDVHIHHISNPISIKNLGPKSQPGSTFLFVGRVSREKGVAIFLEAARRCGIPAVIVGDGPDLGQLKSEYPEAIFHGWLPPTEVEVYLRAARALVFPSVWYEGQPLTIYESLALGTPVIVSDICAGREAIVDGETGAWFKASDVASLCAAISCLQDDDMAVRMSSNAHRVYWEAPLTIERHLDELQKAYSQELKLT
jgi:glycosyltransferase involved in cell wall biosynthesis